MNERKYDNLERMRRDIQKDRDKVEALLLQIKTKEAKLKEAEAVRVVADVEAMKLSPEQIGSLLDMIASGQIQVDGNAINVPVPRMGRRSTTFPAITESNDENSENENKEEDSEDED